MTLSSNENPLSEDEGERIIVHSLLWNSRGVSKSLLFAQVTLKRNEVKTTNIEGSFELLDGDVISVYLSHPSFLKNIRPANVFGLFMLPWWEWALCCVGKLLDDRFITSSIFHTGCKTWPDTVYLMTRAYKYTLFNRWVYQHWRVFPFCIHSPIFIADFQFGPCETQCHCYFYKLDFPREISGRVWIKGEITHFHKPRVMWFRFRNRRFGSKLFYLEFSVVWKLCGPWRRHSGRRLQSQHARVRHSHDLLKLRP